jgi:hypothetical protein
LMLSGRLHPHPLVIHCANQRKPGNQPFRIRYRVTRRRFVAGKKQPRVL